MWTAMADVAALTGDKSYIRAIQKIWEDVICKKFYITGGIGAEGGNEGFAGPYELPNEKAYCETCAAIANVFWNHRMFLMTGEAKYIDVLERSLYNNVLSGVSLEGNRFFYPNPLQSGGQHERSEWFGCACCPSNIARFIPSMPNYIYARKENDFYVNLFVPGSATFETSKGSFKLIQDSNMPERAYLHQPRNRQTTESQSTHQNPGLGIRKSCPCDIYEFMNSPSAATVFKINEKVVTPEIKNGYAVLSKKWKQAIRLT